jgi:hypothetical protein
MTDPNRARQLRARVDVQQHRAVDALRRSQVALGAADRRGAIAALDEACAAALAANQAAIDFLNAGGRSSGPVEE